eukprot:TRINITY_DN3223_c0_g1_i1.p1 TRINITY_DN3223_c0_g1~~TRINITY_DN3223_c0_g1_i1.p1  ORF type:complete len:461 (+),score=105.33 TRINITY_DN3223_c0_g1_i1:115-1497(+)
MCIRDSINAEYGEPRLNNMMKLSIAVTLAILLSGADAGSSDSTPSPTPTPGGTPFNPSNQQYTASLGGYVATTLEQFKQVSSAIPLEGVTPTTTQSKYKIQGSCDPSLGYLWVPTDGISSTDPLSLYYTEGGQIAGMRIDVWGTDAAMGKQVSQGYYIADATEHWYMSVSFRDTADMCSGDVGNETIGDRLVINQDTIAKSVPLTAGDAEAAGFMPGSCMKTMGQHWFYDLLDAPLNSWDSGNLLPIVPMYHPPGSASDLEGTFNAFFFASPKCQGPDNKGADTAYSWDNVPSLIGCGLPPAAMCENFCSATCDTDLLFNKNPWKSSGTEHWATFHILFNEDPKNEPTCPGFSSLDNLDNLPAILAGRTCPDNTAAISELFIREGKSDSDSSSHGTLVALLVVGVAVGVMGAIAFVVWRKQTVPVDVLEVEQLQGTSTVGSCYSSCQAAQVPMKEDSVMV